MNTNFAYKVQPLDQEKLKTAKQYIDPDSVPRRLSREERRAAERAQKKKLRKMPMKEKCWEDITEQCQAITTQINDTKTEVIAQVFNPILDSPEDNEVILKLRTNAKDLEISLDAFAAELATYQGKQAGRSGKIVAEDSSDYDDLQMDLMDFQFRYMQSVIPRATSVALDAADYITALEKKENTPTIEDDAQ